MPGIKVNSAATSEDQQRKLDETLKNVSNSFMEIRTSEMDLHKRMQQLEAKCDVDPKTFFGLIQSIKKEMHAMANQIVNLGKNQVHLQRQLMQMNANMKWNQPIRRSRSLDCPDSMPILKSSHLNKPSTRDSGVNICAETMIAPENHELKESFRNIVTGTCKSNMHINTAENSCRDPQRSTVDNFDMLKKSLMELLDRERNLCNVLSKLQLRYFKPLLNRNLVPLNDLTFVFPDALFNIFETHVILLRQVQETLSDKNQEQTLSDKVQMLFNGYLNAFSVHGATARSYVFYASAYSKIMSLVRMHFFDDSLAMKYLKSENTANSKSVGFFELDAYLKYPLNSVHKYLPIFENLYRMFPQFSPERSQVKKIIVNMSTVEEDIAHSFQVSFARYNNSENHMKPTLKKKRYQTNSLITRRSVGSRASLITAEEFLLDMDSSKRNETTFPLNHNKYDSNSLMNGKSMKSRSSSVESNVYSQSEVNYTANGRESSEEESVATTSSSNGRMHSCDVLSERSSSSKQDKNVSTFRNTIAAFFSKRKNQQRFVDDTPSLIGGGTVNGVKQLKKSADTKPSDQTVKHQISATTERPRKRRPIRTSVFGDGAAINGSWSGRTTLVDGNSREGCVVLAYSTLDTSRHNRYFVESDDSNTSTKI